MDRGPRFSSARGGGGGFGWCANARLRLCTVAIGALLVAHPLAAWPQAPRDRDAARGIAGTVVDQETGQPIPAVDVRVTHEDSPPEGRVTDEEGAFTVTPLEPGAYTVVVERIGYRRAEGSVEVTEGATVIRVELAPEAVAIESVVIVARRSTPGLEGFHSRRRSVMGNGTFITREEIDERNPLRVSDLVGMLPGVRIVPAPFGRGDQILMRGDCRPLLVMDGVPLRQMGGFGLDDLVSPHDVEGLEIYRTTFIPVEFGVGGCGAIAVWTRRGEPGTGRLSWKQTAAVLGGIAAAFLIVWR